MAYTDGAACQETMKCGIGYMITDTDDNMLTEKGVPCESLGTSCEAEIAAMTKVIEELMHAKISKKKESKVAIFTDSHSPQPPVDRSNDRECSVSVNF